MPFTPLNSPKFKPLARPGLPSEQSRVDEPAFRSWYASVSSRYKLNPDPDDPRHHYDYRAAFKAKALPDESGHWPSQFKMKDHPNRYINGIDTITGKPRVPVRPYSGKTYLPLLPSERRGEGYSGYSRFMAEVFDLGYPHEPIEGLPIEQRIYQGGGTTGEIMAIPSMIGGTPEFVRDVLVDPLWTAKGVAEGFNVGALKVSDLLRGRSLEALRTPVTTGIELAAPVLMGAGVKTAAGRAVRGTPDFPRASGVPERVSDVAREFSGNIRDLLAKEPPPRGAVVRRPLIGIPQGGTFEAEAKSLDIPRMSGTEMTQAERVARRGAYEEPPVESIRDVQFAGDEPPSLSRQADLEEAFREIPFNVPAISQKVPLRSLTPEEIGRIEAHLATVKAKIEAQKARTSRNEALEGLIEQANTYQDMLERAEPVAKLAKTPSAPREAVTPAKKEAVAKPVQAAVKERDFREAGATIEEVRARIKNENKKGSRLQVRPYARGGEGQWQVVGKDAEGRSISISGEPEFLAWNFGEGLRKYDEDIANRLKSSPPSVQRGTPEKVLPQYQREVISKAAPSKPNVMTLTDEWQEVPEGMLVPRGAAIKMGMSGGKTIVRKVQEANGGNAEISLHAGVSLDDLRKATDYVMDEIANGRIGKEADQIVAATKEYFRRGGIILPQKKLDEIAGKVMQSDVVPKNKTPQSQEFTAARVQEIMDKQRADMDAVESKSAKTIPQGLATSFYDVSANVKLALSKQGAKGIRALRDFNLVRKAPTRASIAMGDYNRAVFDKMSDAEQRQLSDYRQYLRIIEIDEVWKPENITRAIDEYAEKISKLPDTERGHVKADDLRKDVEAEVKRIDGLKHTGELNASAARTAIDQIDPVLRTKLDQANNIVRNAYRNSLVMRRDAGLINDALFDYLSKYQDYSPRLFLKHLDPPDAFITKHGKRVSVGKSGIETLDEGSYESTWNDTRSLLTQSIARTEAQIARNEANLSLLDLAESGSDIVRVHKIGDPIPSGHGTVSAMRNGVRVEMTMPKLLADEWITSDPELSRTATAWLRALSGTAVLRPMATGLNPLFAITNVPIDIFHILTSTKDFNPTLPIGAAQLFKEMIMVAPDVLRSSPSNPKGILREALENGVSATTFTREGFGQKPGITNSVISSIGDWLGLVGNKSEQLTRVAHYRRVRNRDIAKGVPVVEARKNAANASRSRLDFEVGGRVTKVADTALPYLNTAVQGARGTVRAAKDDPLVFSYKAAQIGGAAIGLYYMNRYINPEAWDQISDYDKASGLIITTPYYEIDDKGEKRYLYFRIPIDQSVRPIYALAQAIVERKEEGKFPSKVTIMAIKSAIPNPYDKMPPALGAIMAYAGNYDFFLMRDVWDNKAYPVGSIKPEYEIKEDTKLPYRQAGRGLGISPARLQAASEAVLTRNNPYMDLLGAGWKALMKDVPEQQQAEWNHNLLTTTPGLKRIARLTNPRNKVENDRLQEIAVEENTRRFVQNEEVKKLFDAGDKKAMKAFLDQQPAEDKRRLRQRVQRMQANKGVPYFYIKLAEETPATRATYFYEKWAGLTEDQQKELKQKTRGIDGFWSSDFQRAFNKLRKAAEQAK